MSSEARTGIVIVLVIAIVIVAWARLGGLARWLGRYEVDVCFSDLHGLDVGASVMEAGVKIGEVAAVSLQTPPKLPGLPATARLSIGRQHDLRQNDRFQISSGSLMGDRYVSVTRGDPPGPILRHEAPVLGRRGPIAVFAGGPPAGFEALASGVGDIAGQVRTSMTSLQQLLGDEQTKRDLRETIRNLNLMSVRAAQIATKALSMIDQVAPANAAKINGLIDNLHEISRSLRLTAAGVNALVSTSTVPDDVTLATHNLAATSKSIERAAAKVEEIVGDPKTSSDIRQTLGNVRAVTEQGSEVVAKTTEVLEKVDRIAGRVDRSLDSVGGLGHVLTRMDYAGHLDLRLGVGDAGRADLDIDVFPNPYRDDFWRVGLRDVGSRNALNLQRGIPLSHRGEYLRFGFMDGTVGVGWDRQWTPRLASEAELYDPSKVAFDVRARYRYDRDWDILAGVDSVFNRPEPFVGARRKFDF
jgi:ABC-type transporter Mla subunit MlaD